MLCLINKSQIGRLQEIKKNKSVNKVILKHRWLHNSSPLMKEIFWKYVKIYQRLLHIVDRAKDKNLGYIFSKQC